MWKIFENGMDIIFAVDLTASVRCWIDIRNSIKFCIEMKLFATSNFGFVAYTDHSTPEFLIRRQYLSKNRKELVEFMNSLNTNFGDDIPEAVLDGIQTAAGDPNWTLDRKKLIILICEAPPHGRNYTYEEDWYHDGCPCGLEEEIVLNRLKDANIRLAVLYDDTYNAEQLEVMVQNFTNIYPAMMEQRLNPDKITFQIVTSIVKTLLTV